MLYEATDRAERRFVECVSRSAAHANRTPASLGMFVVLAAIFVLVRSIMARNATLIATSAGGLVAIFLAFFFGSSFTDKLTNGYSLGMAISFAAALACYTIGLYATSTRSGGPS
jgi:hypothetical protein